MNSKARPKGHIAVKSAEVHPKTSSKNTSHNATLLRFAIIVPIIGKHEERLDASCISEGFLPEVSFSTDHFPKHDHYRGTQQRIPPKYIYNAF